jgi:hypothetical protein
MKTKNGESFCLIHSPDLTKLSYPDDLTIRSAFNDELSRHLKNFIIYGEKIYSLTGHGLLVKLKESNEERLHSLYQMVHAYQFFWGNHQINFHCGVSYTTGEIISKTAVSIFELLAKKIPLSLKKKCPERVFLNDN